MQALGVSDAVDERLYSLEARTRLAGVQIVLAAGDLPGAYLEFLVDLLEVPLYFVFGNHGEEVVRTAGQEPRLPMGCTCLEGRVLRQRLAARAPGVRELLLAGLGGSRRYRPGPHQYNEAEMACRCLGLVPRLLLNRLRYGRCLDILLTHSPPLGIQDGPDWPHRGFRSFRWLMERFAPRYLLHGHYSSYDQRVPVRVRYHQTWVVNVYGYQLLEIDDAA